MSENLGTTTSGDFNLQELAGLVEQLKQENAQLKAQLNQPSGTKSEPAPSSESSSEVAPLSDGDATLRRLVQRIAMILQAEKIVIMFYDKEQGELIGIPPTLGVEEEKLQHFRVRATHGVSGQVFRDGKPLVFHDASADERTQKDMVSLLGVHNGITVPLIIEKRDEENRVVERNTIGVLHAWNKRHGEDFNEEDVRLLERMARNVGSIIANLQLYKQVVEEREKLIQTFESLTSGLMLVSSDGRISQVNAAARAIFPDKEEFVGKHYSEIVTDAELQKIFQEGLSEDGDPVPVEYNVTFGGVERSFNVQGAAVKYEDGKLVGFVSIFIDVTEQKNLDRMKSAFVAMASHELRTPLTAIKGFASTLLMDEAGDIYTLEDRREFYTIIDNECDRLKRLIDDLLNTARIEANESLKPNYTEVDLQALVDKVVIIQKQSTDKHSIFAKIKGDLPKIIGDHDKLDQTFTNLLNNAIKYSPEGGDIIVHGEVMGDMVRFGVEDQGLGIPQDQVDKVFEKFHRVNNDDNRKIYGTGLGLFLVKHLVEQLHMGRIWCESELGKGSIFWFEVPVALDIEKAKEINS